MHHDNSLLATAVPRRAVLKGAGAAAALGWLESHGLLAGVLLNPSMAAAASLGTPTMTTRLVRREDQVNLLYDFYNLTLAYRTGSDGASRPVLVQSDTSNPSVLVVVRLPAQALEEGALFESSQGAQSSTSPLPTNRADDSRLVFALDPARLPLPFTSASLLDWTGWAPRVNPRASATRSLADIVRTQGSPQAPADDETALEVVRKLVFSPTELERFTAALAPVTRPLPPAVTARGISETALTELWHARLVTGAVDPATGALADRARDATLPEPPVRAIWSLDYDNASGGSDFSSASSSLSGSQRRAIVRNSSDYSGVRFFRGRPFGYVPRSIDSREFMVSAYGAYLDLHATWPTDAPERSVSYYAQKSAMGRDYFVRVDTPGYLLPLGHRATLVQITERKFAKDTSGVYRATLFQRFFLQLRQPAKTYGDPTRTDPSGTRAAGDDLRRWPFRGVRILTALTPNLDKPGQGASAGPSGLTKPGGCPPPPPPKGPQTSAGSRADSGSGGFDQCGSLAAFWPVVAGQDVRWSLLGTDWDGQQVRWDSPLLFVASDYSYGPDNLGVLAGYYNSATDPGSPRRARPLSGQRVAMAQRKPGAPAGQTAQEVQVLTAGLGINTAAGSEYSSVYDQPGAYPVMASAVIRLAAAEAAGASSGPPTVTFPDAYVGPGYDPAQPPEGYLQLPSPAQLTFGATQLVGGLGKPDFSIASIGRTLGPTALDAARVSVPNPAVSPADYFSSLADGTSPSSLLGGIALDLVLRTVSAFSPPKIDTKLLHLDADPAKPVAAVDVTVHFATDLATSVSKGGIEAGILDPGPKNQLSLDGSFHTDLLHPELTTAAVVGRLDDVAVNIIGTGALSFLRIDFEKLVFTSKSGQKPTFDVAIRTVDFTGVLTFVNELKDYLKTLGSPLSVDVGAGGVTAGFTLAIPTISVGVFSLANVSLGLAANLPFDGSPARARFNFCTRENPFVLTVSFFGGGGFLGIAAGTDGLELLEAALEFGAQAALDIGVASGGVSIMAGIYFRQSKDTGASLTGFVDLAGELSVLGLISISAQFHLEFQYEFATNKCTGRATLMVKVSVLFFSTTVSLEVEKKFGGGGDPTFGQLYADNDWSDYCAAFAPLTEGA